MKETENIKAYYYFDEAGDPQILGRKGVNLVAEGKASKVFMVGYLETKNPKVIREALLNLQKEIVSDDYLAMIPSLWTIQRAYEKGEFGHYNFLKDKINLVHDIFDTEKYPKNYYSQKNPLEAKKIDPV